ncbi:hypothetical protein RSAG8_03744, partial [Rhizoctonia solani AG-8 WAC10335]
MPLGLRTVMPLLTPFLDFVDDLLCPGYRTRRSEKEALILHIQRVISLLESALTSGNNTDLDPLLLLNLKARLINVLEDLAPSNRSIVRWARARRMCNERFIQETKGEIDTALSLIAFKTVFALNGGLTSLRGGMEHLLSVMNNPSYRTVPDTQFNSGAFSTHNGTCQCGSGQNAFSLSNNERGKPCSARETQREPPIGEDSAFDRFASDQVLGAAYQNVLHHRHLAQQDHRHRLCLVKSLDLLVQLLRRAGRVEDALQHSLEANRLLDILAQEASLPHNCKNDCDNEPPAPSYISVSNCQSDVVTG